MCAKFGLKCIVYMGKKVKRTAHEFACTDVIAIQRLSHAAARLLELLTHYSRAGLFCNQKPATEGGFSGDNDTGHGKAAVERIPHATSWCRGSRGRCRNSNPQGRHQRSHPRLGDQCGNDALHFRQCCRATPLSHDGVPPSLCNVRLLRDNTVTRADAVAFSPLILPHHPDNSKRSSAAGSCRFADPDIHVATRSFVRSEQPM